MGSRYLFIVLYVFLERHLSRGDYRRTGAPQPPSQRQELGDQGAASARADESMAAEPK